ncbi:MAG: FHA domain-containing protein [Gammaproteobacteria bacterium]|nr:FHA domain-containing protein [Gammaproteobacteria bacterium]
MSGIIVQHVTDPTHITELVSGELTLGRAPDNKVYIDDKTVSSHHARIFTYFLVSYIEDLNSTNGTYINGKRIGKHIIKPGDIIALGSYQLRVDHKHLAARLSKTG